MDMVLGAIILAILVALHLFAIVVAHHARLAKFDAISTKDYYALYGYIQSSRYDKVAVDDPAQPGKPLDGMPTLAPWVKEGFTWAPEVMKVTG